MDNDEQSVQPGHLPEPDTNGGSVYTPQVPKYKSGKLKRFLTFLFVLVLLGGATYGAYWYYTDTVKKKDAEIAKLEAENSSLKSQLAETTKDTETDAGLTDDDRDAISKAISDGTYEDLSEYFGESVTIILAASEGLGARTPEQAVTDLKALDEATEPWDFNLPDKTLDTFSSGAYASYFPEDALVGQSANDYVVSVSFNSAGNISTIFIAPSLDVLQA